jgi:23S rRNA (uracil1939-C5)-methyltransferase
LGPFALRLAAGAAITAIDSDAKAAGALQKAARHTQGLKPVHVQTRDLFREPLTAAELGAFDLVVIDPPRAGAEAQSRQVAKSRLQRLVYVSCDPVTFARDAKILCGAGLNLSEVTPVDQFAWSRHVELVAAFSR